ncbi:hypothetical protein ACRAWD_13165 [Caulobacter segnis]
MLLTGGLVNRSGLAIHDACAWPAAPAARRRRRGDRLDHDRPGDASRAAS